MKSWLKATDLEGDPLSETRKLSNKKRKNNKIPFLVKARQERSRPRPMNRKIDQPPSKEESNKSRGGKRNRLNN